MKKRVIIVIVAALALAGVYVMLSLHPPGPAIVCHKGLAGAVDQWKLETTNGDWYPNVQGRSSPSLALISPYYGPDGNALHDYNYVPGLKSTDPKDLILFYVKRSSRRRWHGDRIRFTGEKRWVVLNAQLADGEGDRWSEVGEWISFEEFTNRLAKTLRFLTENGRKDCTNVISEHSALLLSAGK